MVVLPSASILTAGEEYTSSGWVDSVHPLGQRKVPSVCPFNCVATRTNASAAKRPALRALIGGRLMWQDLRGKVVTMGRVEILSSFTDITESSASNTSLSGAQRARSTGCCPLKVCRNPSDLRLIGVNSTDVGTGACFANIVSS